MKNEFNEENALTDSLVIQFIPHAQPFCYLLLVYTEHYYSIIANILYL